MYIFFKYITKGLEGEFKINRVELKELSKSQLKGHWTIPVVLTLLYVVLSTVLSLFQDETNSIPNIIITFILVFGLGVWATVGLPNFYLMFIEKIGNASFRDVLVSMSKLVKSLIFTIIISVVVFVSTFIVMFVVGGATASFIFTDIIWGLGAIIGILVICLFIIALIIFDLALALTPYIIIEHEHLSTIEAMSLSIKMMKGNKWRYFVIQLSFIGWAILAILTLGIGYLWLIPYVSLTQANFYRDLSFNSINN